MDISRLIKTVTEDIDGIAEWTWVKSDTGLWEGPRLDWLTSHKEKYIKHCKLHGYAITAGGGCGMYPRLLSNHFEWVYTFEPDPLSFYCLVNNCPSEKIFKFNAALGAEQRLVSVHRPSAQNIGTNEINENGHGQIKNVLMMRIDDLAFPEVNFIQLDVEGYEANVIRGALKTIEKFKPTISCERGNREILNLLSPFGYEEVDRSVADTIYAVTS